MKAVLDESNDRGKALFRIGCFIAVMLIGSGCSTPEKSDFLTGNEPLRPGKYVDRFWSAGEIHQPTLSKIYIEPVDVSRIKDYPDISALVASNELQQAMVWKIHAQTDWTIVESADPATAKIALAITCLNPGSAAARIWAAELGAGHAIVQVDGRLVDAGTGKDLACFEDRQRDSGAIGLEDVGGDAGPRMIQRMLESISSNFVKELSESAR